MPKGIPGRPSCSIEGCDQPHESRGWCARHYRRWLAHGDPLWAVRTRGTPVERFWKKVSKDGPVPAQRPEIGPCWVWEGTITPKGYGQLWVSTRTSLAHRFAYELLVGPIPEGLTIDHLCHNDSGCRGGNDCPHRRCVNPAHLEAVPAGVNAQGRNGPAMRRPGKRQDSLSAWSPLRRGEHAGKDRREWQPKPRVSHMSSRT